MRVRGGDAALTTLRRRRVGADAAFVLAAVHSFATGTSCPRPPVGNDWIAVADSAGVLLIVLDGLRRRGLPLPDGAEAWSYVPVVTQMRAHAELGVLSAVLGEAGVRWVVLKGPILADLAYARPFVRAYSDLDVLIHPEDLGVALDALQAAGYQLLDQNWRLIGDSSRGEISLSRPGGMFLDLHWHVINERRTRSQLRLDVRTLFERCWRVSLEGLSLPILSPTDNVLHVALHACLSGAHRLSWLVDVQQAVLWSGCDAAKLREAAAGSRVLLPLQAVIARAARFVDPGLWQLAEELAVPNAWRSLCAAVSRTTLPLGGGDGLHTGRLVFSSTRGSTGESILELARMTGASVRERVGPLRRSPTLEELRAPGGGEEDRRRWLREAAADG